jgi:hypothetical protein
MDISHRNVCVFHQALKSSFGDERQQAGLACCLFFDMDEFS